MTVAFVAFTVAFFLCTGAVVVVSATAATVAFVVAAIVVVFIVFALVVVVVVLVEFVVLAVVGTVAVIAVVAVVDDGVCESIDIDGCFGILSAVGADNGVDGDGDADCNEEESDMDDTEEKDDGREDSGVTAGEDVDGDSFPGFVLLSVQAVSEALTGSLDACIRERAVAPEAHVGCSSC